MPKIKNFRHYVYLYNKNIQGILLKSGTFSLTTCIWRNPRGTTKIRATRDHLLCMLPKVAF